MGKEQKRKQQRRAVRAELAMMRDQGRRVTTSGMKQQWHYLHCMHPSRTTGVLPAMVVPTSKGQP